VELCSLSQKKVILQKKVVPRLEQIFMGQSLLVQMVYGKKSIGTKNFVEQKVEFGFNDI